jgi:hypothetical protein
MKQAMSSSFRTSIAIDSGDANTQEERNFGGHQQNNSHIFPASQFDCKICHLRANRHR